MRSWCDMPADRCHDDECRVHGRETKQPPRDRAKTSPGRDRQIKSPRRDR